MKTQIINKIPSSNSQSLSSGWLVRINSLLNSVNNLATVVLKYQKGLSIEWVEKITLVIADIRGLLTIPLVPPTDSNEPFPSGEWIEKMTAVTSTLDNLRPVARPELFYLKMVSV